MIIDFTPHHQPYLFALTAAVYWYHLYGHDGLDLDAVRASLAAAASQRPRTDLEAALWPAMLAREVLRRLATPLAIAAERPAGPPPASPGPAPDPSPHPRASPRLPPAPNPAESHPFCLLCTFSGRLPCGSR